MKEIIACVLNDLEPQGRRVRASLPDDMPEVLADPALFERILTNLVANTVRYSPPVNRYC